MTALGLAAEMRAWGFFCVFFIWEGEEGDEVEVEG